MAKLNKELMCQRERFKKMPLTSNPSETWTISKPKVSGSKGVVVAQEIEAASVGAGIIDSNGTVDEWIWRWWVYDSLSGC